ncbi:MAG: DeoR/GlpR family DNA-binding transcription regulator [Acuticoccus sp.]
MKLEDRRQEIIEVLVQDGSASLEVLSQRFGVSKMTIHRDLDDLEASGLLRKVRGGATIEASSQFESDFRYRARRAVAEKRRIARAAARFVEPGMSVMVDDGSTSQLLAPHLAEARPLTVITNNLAVIEVLAGAGGINLIAIGGTYSRKFNGFFGIVAEDNLKGLRADMAFVSSSAIDRLSAFHQDQEVVQVKRQMIRSAARRYLLADHEKFGRTALHFLADLDVFNGIVTGAPPARETGRALGERGIRLHIAQEETTT